MRVVAAAVAAVVVATVVVEVVAVEGIVVAAVVVALGMAVVAWLSRDGSGVVVAWTGFVTLAGAMDALATEAAEGLLVLVLASAGVAAAVGCFAGLGLAAIGAALLAGRGAGEVPRSLRRVPT